VGELAKDHPVTVQQLFYLDVWRDTLTTMFNNNNNNSERLATTTTLAADFLHCSLKLGFVRAICPLNTSWKARSWPRQNP
jgi:hypothetical protein